MTTAKNVMKMIKDNDVKYVDFRFTDPRGKWQHVTFDVSMIEEDTFAEGQMFDGSSIAGWKAINESDMNLMPDPPPRVSTRSSPRPRLVAGLRRARADHGRALQPRSARHRQEGRSAGQVDRASATRSYFGPGSRVLRVRRRQVSKPIPTTPASRLDSIELPSNSDTEYEGGNLGHRVGTKKGYFPVPPQDSAQDMRSEMLGAMARMGAKVEKHHHEVASAQHELGLKFSPLTQMADMMQVYKYCIQQVAQIYGKTATFMPKPVYGDNGSRHALPSVDLESWQAGIRRQQICRPVRNLPLLHRRHHQARQVDQRLHQPDHQFLQASGAGLRGAGAARLLGAQPLGVLPHSLHRPTRRPSASRFAFPTRSAIRISASPRC